MAIIELSATPLPPSLLTVEELSVILNMSERSIWRMRSGGRLPDPIKVGGSIRWRRADIDAWIAEGYPSTRTLLQQNRS